MLETPDKLMIMIDDLPKPYVASAFIHFWHVLQSVFDLAGVPARHGA
jgi:hypothetical protein